MKKYLFLAAVLFLQAFQPLAQTYAAEVLSVNFN
jgi:hypothetical protein